MLYINSQFWNLSVSFQQSWMITCSWNEVTRSSYSITTHTGDRWVPSIGSQKSWRENLGWIRRYLSLFITGQIELLLPFITINKPVMVNSNIEMGSTGVPTISRMKALCTIMVINICVKQLWITFTLQQVFINRHSIHNVRVQPEAGMKRKCNKKDFDVAVVAGFK